MAMLKKTIKVMHIQLFSHMTGVQRVAYDEMKTVLTTTSHIEYYLMCQSKGVLTKKCDELGVVFFENKWLRRNISIIYDIAALLRAVIVILKVKPNVVHTHSSKTGIIGRLAAFMCRTPTIIHTVHGFAFPAAKNAIRKNFYIVCEILVGLITDRLIVLSGSDFQIATQTLRMRESKIMLLKNAIDQNLYNSLNRSSKTGGGVFKFAVIGRLAEQKNQSLLVKAFASTRIRCKRECELLIVGDGEDREKIVSLVKECKCETSVKILGWRNDIPKILDEVDAVVVPSLWEGMSLTVIEAMASGVPVIASDIPGNTCLISHKKTGLLFKSSNVASLTDAMLEILESHELRSEISKNSIQYVKSGHNLVDRSSVLINLYEHGCELARRN